MKIQHLIPILLLAGFCTVSAQTINTNTPALLTTNQAQLLAIQLANISDKFKTNSFFKDTFTIQTHFESGHWITTISNDGGLDGTFVEWIVEIAPDGSTNAVKIKRTLILQK